MRIAVALFVLLCALQLYPVTFVYNLKVATSTRFRSFRFDATCPFLGALTPVQQWKKRYVGTEQSITGGLATFIYNGNPWYLEIDWAAAKVKQESFSRIQTDDILITGGYSRVFSETNRGSLSVLLGIPTHKDEIFKPIQFGLNHVGLGVQLDDSWTYSSSEINYLFTAFRYLRFFPRKVHNCIGGIALPYTFNIGNSVDLLIAHATNWGKHKIEFGYNPTFAFGASICPALPIVTRAASGIRNGFYANYRYAFLLKTHAAGIVIGSSYSFDSKPKDLGFKRIVSVWGTFGMCF